jgi:hypothetical protein
MVYENRLGICGELTTYRVWRALAVCPACVVLHFWGSNSNFDFMLLQVPTWMDFGSKCLNYFEPFYMYACL